MPKFTIPKINLPSLIQKLKLKTKKQKVIFWVVLSLISLTNPLFVAILLIGLILFVPTYYGYKFLKNHPKVTPRFEKIGTVFIFLGMIFGFGAMVQASSGNRAKPPVISQVASQQSSSSIDQSSSQSKASSEAQSIADQKLQEKTKKENEAKNLLIDNAQTVNQSMDFDESISDNQKIDEVKKFNLQIATLGSTTKDQKLFDVLAVVDGDTIKVSELGTLRLIGIDTPETKDPRKAVQCFGKEASQYAIDNLQGKKVYLEFDPANRIDKYNRTLAYVYREDGYNYNLEAVKNGYAFAYTKYPNPRVNEFLDAQKTARESSKGLWSSSTCNGESKPAELPKPAVIIPIPIPIPITIPTPKPPVNTTPQKVTPEVNKDNPPVKLTTSSGLCHAQGERGYNQTKYFTPFNSIQECLDAGGKIK